MDSDTEIPQVNFLQNFLFFLLFVLLLELFLLLLGSLIDNSYFLLLFAMGNFCLDALLQQIFDITSLLLCEGVHRDGGLAVELAQRALSAILAFPLLFLNNVNLSSRLIHRLKRRVVNKLRLFEHTREERGSRRGLLGASVDPERRILVVALGTNKMSFASMQVL